MILAKDVPYYMIIMNNMTVKERIFVMESKWSLLYGCVCAKYPICDFFVTIHVTLTVLVLSSLKTGKKLERYSRSYNAFGMAKLFWVCVGVTTDVVTKQWSQNRNLFHSTSILNVSLDQGLNHLVSCRARNNHSSCHALSGIRCWATEYMSASAC
jgi:hypothetical protein